MRYHSLHKICILVLIVLATSLYAPVDIFAAGSTHSVLPLIIDEKARARDILKESVTITNKTGRKITIYTIVNDVTVGIDGGIEEYNGPSIADRSHSLSNWIQIGRGVIDLAPGEQKTIPFTIQVNLDAEPGVYHSKVSFIEGPNITEAQKKIDQSPALIVNVEIADETKELLQLKQFVSDNVFFSGSSATLTYKIENIGNTDIVPKGEILIYDRKGKEVRALPVNIEAAAIAPKSVGEFHAAWEGGSRAGRYKALLNVEYGNKQRGTLNDTVFFFFVPIVKIAIVFFVSLAAVLTAVHFMHKRQKRAHAARRREAHPHGSVAPRAAPARAAAIRVAPVRSKKEPSGHVMDLRNK